MYQENKICNKLIARYLIKPDLQGFQNLAGLNSVSTLK